MSDYNVIINTYPYSKHRGIMMTLILVAHRHLRLA